MSPKTGRPILGDSRKDMQIGFRVSRRTVEQFEQCQKLSGKTKVELFETMVGELYQKLTKE